MSFNYLYWRGRALSQAYSSPWIKSRMSVKEKIEIEQEIEDITKKLKVLAKKELKKAGLLDKKGELKNEKI